MKSLKAGLVALTLVASGCGASNKLQSFTDLVRSPRPYEYSSMRVNVDNGHANAELYFVPEGYTISVDGDPFFIHTEKNGNSLIYGNPRVSYHDFDGDGRVDLVISNGDVCDSRNESVDKEYQKVLSDIRQERVQRVWEYRWR